jgi:hypothetical protein
VGGLCAVTFGDRELKSSFSIINLSLSNTSNTMESYDGEDGLGVRSTLSNPAFLIPNTQIPIQNHSKQFLI